MNITLQGDSLRSVEYEDENDIVLGRPGTVLPTRQRRIARVMSTGSGLAVDPGTAPPVLLDLTPDREFRASTRAFITSWVPGGWSPSVNPARST